MEVDDVEVGAVGKLRWDITGEAVGGEVKDGEIYERLEVRGDWAGD